MPNALPLIVCAVILSLQSCGTKKDILYFQDSKKELDYSNTLVKANIQINDILDIKVNSKIPATAVPFNNYSAEATVNLDILRFKGYLVDNSGNITFPVLGKLKVTDKSTSELEEFLSQQLISGELMVDALVTVRILNSKITILGEVNKPGTYSFSEQNLTILQALGLAGDLSINGKRKDILLIKMEGNSKKITQIDMTKTDWINSADFFVKNNDVIVVNPNNSKVKSSGFFGNPATILTIASLILSSVILITR